MIRKDELKSYQNWYDFLKIKFFKGYNCLVFDDCGDPTLVKDNGRLFFSFHSFIDCLINEYDYTYFKYCK